ncbi:MAG: alpha/beta fold hydrolase [Bacteroidota bacterium]
MKILLATLLATVFFMLGFIAQAVAQPAALKTGDLDHINSEVLAETRQIYIHLPNGYHEGNDKQGVDERKQYPVLLVLDAEWNFRKVVGIVDNLSASERIPPHIIIGIPNTLRAGRPARIQDLAPSMNTAEDGASSFLSFIADELIPHLDQTYRTEPHYTLLGHSMGGLFTIYALLERPESFAAFIAISPSLGRNNQQQVARASAVFAEQANLNKNLHVVLGNEGGNTQAGTEALVSILEQAAPEKLKWQFHPMVSEDHVSVFLPGTYKAMEAIFDGWKIPEAYLTDLDISIVERHYAALSDKLGFDVPVPARYYTEFGYKILATQEYDYAQWTFEQYAAAYPHAAGPHVGMGDVQLMQGAFEAAQAAYKAALERNANNTRAQHMLDTLLKR